MNRLVARIKSPVSSLPDSISHRSKKIHQRHVLPSRNSKLHNHIRKLYKLLGPREARNFVHNKHRSFRISFAPSNNATNAGLPVIVRTALRVPTGEGFDNGVPLRHVNQPLPPAHPKDGIVG